MKYVFPRYYKDFRCIGDECQHNCCIGWEIDIDNDTYEYYKTISGDIGKQLANNISTNCAPHFVLGENERCPFLNGDNLCDLIIKLGEESLCDICNEHPRFYNEVAGRLEVGLGLCCEAAARLILGNQEPFVLECDESLETDNDILILRDKIINILQNRDKDIDSRIGEMLLLSDATMSKKDISEWVDFLLSLERLDEKWTKMLKNLKEKQKAALKSGFDKVMIKREIEYEQLLVYFIYRHFTVSEDLEDAKSRALFAVFGYMIVREIGAVIYNETGEFTLENQVEIARLFSSEIEYSEENFYKVLKELL